MSGVLGVDLSLSSTGWAWLSSEFWANRPDQLRLNNADAIKTKPSEPAMARYTAIAHRLVEVAVERSVDVVAIEGYSYGSPFGAIAAGELGGIVRYVLDEAHIPVTTWAVKSWRKMAFGDGNLQKDAIRLALFKKYEIEVRSMDVVEAVGIALAEGAARFLPPERMAKYQLAVMKSRAA